jgi:hypothetical protein
LFVTKRINLEGVLFTLDIDLAIKSAFGDFPEWRLTIQWMFWMWAEGSWDFSAANSGATTQWFQISPVHTCPILQVWG